MKLTVNLVCVLLLWSGHAAAQAPDADGHLDGGVDVGIEAGVEAPGEGRADAGAQPSGLAMPPFAVDAGVPDAGAPPTSIPTPTLEPPAGSAAPTSEGVLGVLSEMLFERTERAAAEAQRAETEARLANQRLSAREASGSEAVDVTVRLVGADGSIAGWRLPDPRIKTAGLVFLILIGLCGVFILSRAREALPERGLLPRALGLSHLALRGALIVMGIMLASRLLPEWLRPGLLLGMGAIALSIGAGAIVMLLPDVVGGLLILTEGRLRAGLWIEGDGFGGTIVRVGPRLTVLRSSDGAELTVPNRFLVKSRIHATERVWHEVEVVLEVSSDAAALSVRRAIEETVLCSPFVPVDPSLRINRDPSAPTRWIVRARVLAQAFEDRFAGQLLERVEDALAGGG